MNTASELIDRFGGPTAFGKAIDVRPSAASEMKRRQSIPVVYWQRLVEAAHERAFEDVTYESLTVMHSPPQAPADEPADTAAEVAG